MDSKRSLSSSAMIDLKAELHRKQEEFRRQKVDHGQNIKGRKIEKIKTKKNILNQQNRGVSERSRRDIEEKVEEEDDLVKSRRMLAHKTKLYNEMASSSNIPDEDGSEGFLVDFQRKAVNRMVEDREKQRKEEEQKREDEAENKALAEPIPEPMDSDEEWVDFTDSLGRSRRCMKKDLAKMKIIDRDLAGEVKSKVSREEKKTDPDKDRPDPELMSSDMYREKMRQKWEAEEQALIDKGQEEIHYSNVQFDEIRSHGVGYYQFSKDEDVRQEQMEQLKKLREETVNESSRKDRIQAKRKAMMEARLAKVRDRRKLKAVLISDNKSEEEKAEENEALAKQKAEEEEKRRKKEEAEKEAVEVRKNHIREWDKEKEKNSWSGKGYVEARRNERESEFAPPSVYFNVPRPQVKSTNVSNETRIKRLKQSMQSSGTNPEFAPPASYYEQDKKIRHDKQEETKTSQPASVSASLMGNNKPQKSFNEDKLPTDLTSSNSIDTVSLESIPLPSDDVNEGKGDMHHQTSLLSAVPMDSHQHETYSQHNVDSYGSNLQYQQPSHHQQLHQQQQQQNQQQTQQPYQQQQHFYQQQQYDNYNQSQHEPWMAYQHQQQQQYHHHHQYQQQQGFPSQPTEPHPPQINITRNTTSQEQPQSNPPKRPASNNRQEITTTKKPKVPKCAIVDTRFLLNDLPASKLESSPSFTDSADPSPIQAVPYQPGSFTAARFPKGEISESSVGVGHDTSTTAQIAGGPQLYSKQQLEEQQKQIDEASDTEDGNEDDQKLNDFLASIRAETK